MQVPLSATLVARRRESSRGASPSRAVVRPSGDGGRDSTAGLEQGHAGTLGSRFPPSTRTLSGQTAHARASGQPDGWDPLPRDPWQAAWPILWPSRTRYRARACRSIAGGPGDPSTGLWGFLLHSACESGANPGATPGATHPSSSVALRLRQGPGSVEDHSTGAMRCMARSVTK
jgi:hypothetical protein